MYVRRYLTIDCTNMSFEPMYANQDGYTKQINNNVGSVKNYLSQATVVVQKYSTICKNDIGCNGSLIISFIVNLYM